MGKASKLVLSLIVVLAGILPTITSTASEEDGGWSGPSPLLEDQIFVIGPPRIDMGESGYAIAAWEKGEPKFCFEACHPNPSKAQIAIREPGSPAFGEEQNIAPGDTHGLEFGIAEDEDLAFFVWHTRKVGIQYRTHSPIVGFGPIQTLADSAKRFSFDIAHDGTAAVSWQENGGPVVSLRAPGGSFETPVPAPLDGIDQLSVAAEGGVAVVDEDDTVDSLEPLAASTMEPGQQSFGPREEIDRLRGFVSWPRIQMADDGTVAVLGDIEKRGDFQIRASVRPPGGAFGPATDITGDLSGSFPEVDADATGRMIVVWQRYRGSHTPRLTAYSDGSGWAPSEPISDDRAGFSWIDVAPAGQTIVGIEGLDDRKFTDALAVTSDDDLAFEDPRLIDRRSARNALVQHDVAISSSGEAVAVWADGLYGRRTQIFVSSLAPSPR